jgi:hypothetical protein
MRSVVRKPQGKDHFGDIRIVVGKKDNINTDLNNCDGHWTGLGQHVV